MGTRFTELDTQMFDAADAADSRFLWTQVTEEGFPSRDEMIAQGKFDNLPTRTDPNENV